MLSISKNNLISKKWGTTQCLYCGPLSEIYILQIEQYGQSSIHLHEKKWNRFYLLEGELEITTFDDEHSQHYQLLSENQLDISPGTKHQFKCISKKCTCLEIYWICHIDPMDIIRFKSTSD